MNDGIDELRKCLPEIHKREAEIFFKKLCHQFVYKEKIKPIKMKLDSPYLLLKLTIDDFKKLENYVGHKPNWDLNWGHMFWCTEAFFDWKKNEVSCIFQNENESLNLRKFLPQIRLHETHFSIKCPPNLLFWVEDNAKAKEIKSKK